MDLVDDVPTIGQLSPVRLLLRESGSHLLAAMVISSPFQAIKSMFPVRSTRYLLQLPALLRTISQPRNVRLLVLLGFGFGQRASKHSRLSMTVGDSRLRRCLGQSCYATFLRVLLQPPALLKTTRASKQPRPSLLCCWREH